MDKATRLIRLRGQLARGRHRFAVVDAEDYARLNAHAWKAKRNAHGGRIYAVRNIGNRMVRLHREVMGVEPGEPVDVRMRDHDPLNCRRENLEVTSRSGTVRGTRHRKRYARCLHCNSLFAYWSRSSGRGYCSDSCRQAGIRAREALRKPPPVTVACGWCGAKFIRKRSEHLYCRSTCRHRSKNERNRPVQQAERRESARLRAQSAPTRPCDWCGGSFVPRTGQHRFCCTDCRYAALLASRRKKPHDDQ